MFLVGCRGLGTNSGGQDQVKQINHIIVLAQENRGFEPLSWRDAAILGRQWLYGPVVRRAATIQSGIGRSSSARPCATNLGCDPALGPPHDCTVNANSPQVESFHMIIHVRREPQSFLNEKPRRLEL